MFSKISDALQNFDFELALSLTNEKLIK
jgi:hypothetical protein